MAVSSRTPEGEPNRCPFCEAEVWIEPSQLAGEAPCPQCSHLLWFVPRHEEPSEVDLIEPESFRDRLTRLLRTKFLLSPEEIDDRLPIPLESRHVHEYLPLLEYLGQCGELNDSWEYD